MNKFPRVLSLLATLLAAVPTTQAQIAPGELVAPKMEISGADLIFTVQPSVSGRNYQLQYSDSMVGGTWLDLGVVRSGDGTNLAISTPYDTGVQRWFYRFALIEAPPAPTGLSLISAGSFQMGDALDGLSNAPVHSVYVSEFYMGKYEVTKELWDEVRAWGLLHGYTNLPEGSMAGTVNYSKGQTHPVHLINWYAMVKWCNARSQKEGLTPCYTVSGSTYKTGSSAPDCNWSANGYRLPTEAEWEKAARGGLSGKRFPWGDTITHSQANYYSISSYAYDVSPTRDFHPIWGTGSTPYTSPVGSFSPNGYGLYDMTGCMREWCWDWYGSSPSGSQTDPRGPDSGSNREYRGGAWNDIAPNCRVAFRNDNVRYDPGYSFSYVGFRLARSSVP